MSIKVTALDLDRIVQNALLFADKNANRLREVLFIIEGSIVTVYACDDYFVISDSLEIQENPTNGRFTLSVEDLEILGKWIKQDKKVVHKYQISIQQKFTGTLFECDETSTDEESDNIFLNHASDHTELWERVHAMLDLNRPLITANGFLVRPERFMKLSRFKAPKEAPIAFRFVDVRGTMIIQFKLGTTLFGAIIPVFEEYVQEEFLW